MNRSQLAGALTQRKPVANKDFHTFRANQRIVEIFFGIISDALLEGNRVEIRGFGSFTVKNYRSYMGRDPRNGDPVMVKPKKLPYFRPGKTLKEAVDSKV
jgi:integration host factor subunit beta